MPGPKRKPMSIWTSKASAAALSVAALAGCDAGLPFGGGAPAVTRAEMAFGAVALQAPRGYCIDQATLREDFALLARCDTLGAPAAAAGAPLGVMTVSLAPAPEDGAIPDAQTTAAALSLEGVTKTRDMANAVMFQASGAAPIENMSDVQWRGTALIGTQLMGLALYGPENGRAVGLEGRELMTETISNTKSAL